MSEAADVRSEEQLESDLVAYRAVSGWAVFSVLLGLASTLAVFLPQLWAIPLFALLVSIKALAHVRAGGGNLVGRKAALLGLGLALMCGSAVPVQLVSARWWLTSEARSVAEDWLQALKSGEPLTAHELSLPLLQRMPVKTPLDQYYSGRPEAREEFDRFRTIPVVETLLALGDKAQSRFYEAEEIEKDGDREIAFLYYAVTYEESAAKKSFFIRFMLERTVNRDTRRAAWRILKFDGGVRPPTPPQ